MAVQAKVTVHSMEILVEVTDVGTNLRGEKVAEVQALYGEPFVRWTHGGWIYDKQSRIDLTALHDIIVTDSNQ